MSTQQEKHERTQQLAIKIAHVDADISVLNEQREQLCKLKDEALKDEQDTCEHPNWTQEWMYGWCPDCLVDDL